MKRPDLVAEAKPFVSTIERTNLQLIQRTFSSQRAANSIKWLQKQIGTRWIDLATGNLRHTHHTERLPKLESTDSFILVSNHRSFFDLYVVTIELIAAGLNQRMVFPVRSRFFYDHPLGLAVNGAMSFFAMYPPMFRDRKRGHLNLLGLDELAWLLQQGGHFVGFHPEGTRNQGDPYQLLPARAGVGKLVHTAQVPVIPVFINGLLPDNLKQQVRSNFDGTGVPIHIVFGAPMELDDLLQEKASQSVYKRIANRVRSVIMDLGQEEKAIREAQS